MSNSFLDFLKENTCSGKLPVMDLPRHSADLNIIEAVCYHVDREQDKKHPKKALNILLKDYLRKLQESLGCVEE